MQQAVFDLGHLPQSRLVGELLAVRADAEGARGREVDEVAGHAHFLLGVQHAVQGADDGLDEAPRLEDAWQLQVRLVDDDHRAQGRVVALAGEDRLVLHEAVQQVHAVLGLEELVAVVAAVHAVALHLRVGVVAHADHDLELLRMGLIEEGRVVGLRGVAVEPHVVGAQEADGVEVGPAPRAPHRLCRVAHEVVHGNVAVRTLAGYGPIADAFDNGRGAAPPAPPPPSAGLAGLLLSLFGKTVILLLCLRLRAAALRGAGPGAAAPGGAAGQGDARAEGPVHGVQAQG
mmetsp:Transcript_71484/g.209506  ORF Transcript_71484/g.209506 Transcript_71484/m.209506 type:complete len:288 (+) Transcript_71484:1605-2468(+)